MNSYQYDSANRLSNVNSVNHTFDNNGNLLNDGVNTYVYDSANRLISVSNQSSVNSYQYNGLGDRLVQNGTQYTLDLNAGLTQVLNDSENSYVYGLGRISQTNVTNTEYFLGDALGSVRQLTNNVGDITLVNNYEPYGTNLSSAGDSESPYGFTGEYTDSTGNIYLRARYYNPNDGRFLSRDTWNGDLNNPLSLNRWMYTEGNPVNYVDPTGLAACQKRGSGRICVLNNGGFLDLAHFRQGEALAAQILKGLKRGIGIKNYDLPLEQPLLPAINYPLTYKTSIPSNELPSEGLLGDDLKRIALGIFMDFQIRYERFQANDPRCILIDDLALVSPACSSFSNEDLVSDYLGFSMYMKNISFEQVISELGGGYSSETKPSGIHPRNYKFTSFRLIEINCGEIKIVQRQIPPSLLLDSPIESGQFWEVPAFHFKIDLDPWL